MDVPIENCISAKIYRPDSFKKILVIIFITLLYIVSLPACYYTAGEPRALAMIQAQKLIDKRWNLANKEAKEEDNSAVKFDNTLFETSSEEKTENEEEFEPIFIDLEDDEENDKKSSKINLLNNEDKKIDDEVVYDEFGIPINKKFLEIDESKSSSSGNFITRFFTGNKETKRAQQEFEQWKKELKNNEADDVTLPPEYLPSAWACLLLFLTLTTHALFHLMCHWNIKFKALTLFKSSKTIDLDSYVLIQPPLNRGNAELVPIKQFHIKNFERLYCEFQHQKYLYTSPNDLDSETAKNFKNGVFTLLAYPINQPIEFYLTSQGLTSEEEISTLIKKFDKNNLTIKIPGFLELLKAQLLSPLSIFQFFCALLWLIDDYWSYFFFTIFSVIMYEATTVFQRSRTQKMLGGMSPKPSPVYVYRNKKWIIVASNDLLPGDIMSVSYKKQATKKSTDVTTTSTAATANSPAQTDDSTSPTSRNEIIQCDCILLRGSAVVNEASLTGESIPQMKESLIQTDYSDNEKLDYNGIHRVNTLFSGCSLITVSNSNSLNPKHDVIPSPPDSGAIAYVLRTGFGSSQGSLLQMIEFSQQNVSGNSRETGLALLLLFFFALLASGYVLKIGIEKGEKTTHELLLRCIIIITSVVPRQFPMQMAVAVNMALMTLSKANIFCTEPYRVPLAGKISHCLFDKTGTITTDQLVPVGIIGYNSDKEQALEEKFSRYYREEDVEESDEKVFKNLTPVEEAEGMTAIILAGCHSLVEVSNDNSVTPANINKNELFTENYIHNLSFSTNDLTGDPIELAAMKSIDWFWDNKSSTAYTDGGEKKVLAGIKLLENEIDELNKDKAVNKNYAKELENKQKAIENLNKLLKVKREKNNNLKYHKISIIQRYHFSSSLQRMSVIVKCFNNLKDKDSEEYYILVKGSPEILSKLIDKKKLPKWYNIMYEKLARKGLRILSLGYKKLKNLDEVNNLSRQELESNLNFGGFIAFECKVRGDSAIVIKSLRESDHKVIMLTGDSLLTSFHVSKKVHICDKNKSSYSLSFKSNEENKDDIKNYYWKYLDSNNESKDLPFELSNLEDIAQKYNLLATEEYLFHLISITGKDESPLWKIIEHFKVLSRMSPYGKTEIIERIQKLSKNYHVFMCGDGGNDVGALKQADVSIALLSGHANSNTSTELTVEEEYDENGELIKKSEKSAEDVLNEHENQLKKRTEDFNKLRQAHMKEFQRKFTAEQQAKLQEELKKRTEAGEYGAMFTLMKEQTAMIKRAMLEENKRFMAQHGQVWDPKMEDEINKSVGGSGLESLLGDSGDAMGLPLVRPGDASVAAPFTSRIPSIRAVIDLIRQGRCTLLSALMQQQIMMLESIITAYTLSALSLHNARSSERQMMLSSWLLMSAGLSFSYSSPINKMHPLRPLSSLFHPSVILSTLGQALIHILCMTLAVRWATEAMGPEKLNELTEFFKRVKESDYDRYENCADDDFMCQFQSYWMAPFMPNLLNSTVFLVETSQMISVYFTNYKGRPWMKGLLENHTLFLSIFLCIGSVIFAAWEFSPQINDMLQLTPFPDDAYRYRVLLLVFLSIFGTFLWDRFCIMIFSKNIFRAMWHEMMQTTPADLVPILKTVVMIAAGLFILSTGNILLGIGAYYYYSNYMKKNN